jgi:hypothetical protein
MTVRVINLPAAVHVEMAPTRGILLWLACNT